MITLVRKPIRPAPRPRSEPPPRIVGAETVQALDRYPPLPFRGREYPVGRISYLDGIELHRRWLLVAEFQQAKELTAAELERWGHAVAAVIGQCYQLLADPKPRENPFVGATPRELGSVVGFFFARLRDQETGLSAGKPRRSI